MAAGTVAEVPVHHGVERVDRALHVADQGLRGGGGDRALREAFEERGAELAFEGADLVGDGRIGRAPADAPPW